MERLDNTPFGGLFKGKRILLTGHTGFKGSWLSVWLTRLGAEVYGYSLHPPTNPNLFDEIGVADIIHHHEIGDVRDLASLKRAVKHAQPEFVFHLAAQAIVRRSYLVPVETYEVNVLGTVNLLEAIRSSDCVRVCQIVTSDKCYENREWVYAYRENDPMGGYDPYSSSKGCAELVASSYSRSFFNFDANESNTLSLASARAGNVIGGGDWAEDRIIPDCVKSLSSGVPIIIRNPHAIRPWQHVLEPLSGYLCLAAHQWIKPEHFVGGWNFGPRISSCISVGSLADLIVTEWGSGVWRTEKIREDNEQNGGKARDVTNEALLPHEANFLKLDISKAETQLSWIPVFSVNEAVHESIKWYRSRKNSDGGLHALEQQICGYEEKARSLGVRWAFGDT